MSDKRQRSKALLAIFVLFPLFAFAQTEVDLKLEVTANPPFPWRVGQIGVVSMKVTNLSPTQGVLALIRPVPPIPANVPPTDAFNALAESCPRSAECTAFGMLCNETPPIFPGQTVSCDFTLQALIARNRPARERNYVFPDFGFSFPDPDLSNNFAQIEASIVSEVVLVPISPFSYLALLVAIGGMGIFAARSED